MWSATDSMRIELGTRGVQVMGVYVGLVDTDMAKFTDYPKSDPPRWSVRFSTGSSPAPTRFWPTR